MHSVQKTICLQRGLKLVILINGFIINKTRVTEQNVLKKVCGLEHVNVPESVNVLKKVCGLEHVNVPESVNVPEKRMNFIYELKRLILDNLWHKGPHSFITGCYHEYNYTGIV